MVRSQHGLPAFLFTEIGTLLPIDRFVESGAESGASTDERLHQAGKAIWPSGSACGLRRWAGRWLFRRGPLPRSLEQAERQARWLSQWAAERLGLEGVQVEPVNRADTARVFGELITFIEADKRDLPFRIAQDPKIERTIPENLHFLGTMNTADRSVSLLDVALRRRFAFAEFSPDPAAFGSNSPWIAEIAGVSLEKLMRTINERLISIGVESDRAIGHALFGVAQSAADPLAELRDRVQYDIYPLIVDYCFSDRTRVAEVLSPLVGADGRLLSMTNDQFLAALKSLVGGAVSTSTSTLIDSGHSPSTAAATPAG